MSRWDYFNALTILEMNEMNGTLKKVGTPYGFAEKLKEISQLEVLGVHVDNMKMYREMRHVGEDWNRPPEAQSSARSHT
jgi:hypothetical protein